MNTTQPPKGFQPKVASNTPAPAKLPEQQRTPLTEADKERLAHEKTRQTLAQQNAERIKAEAEAREREGKAIHRHGVWRGRTEGVVIGIPLGVLIVFLAAMSLQDRFSFERWSGAREAVSSEYRAGVISPPPAGLAKPDQ